VELVPEKCFKLNAVGLGSLVMVKKYMSLFVKVPDHPDLGIGGGVEVDTVLSAHGPIGKTYRGL
jgi:hypothetical protein